MLYTLIKNPFQQFTSAEIHQTSDELSPPQLQIPSDGFGTLLNWDLHLPMSTFPLDIGLRTVLLVICWDRLDAGGSSELISHIIVGERGAR